MFQNRRVVVTGLGTVTSAGLGIDKFWNKIKKSESFISHIKNFNVDDINSRIGGEVIISEEEMHSILSQQEIAQRRKIDDFIFFGLIAANEAIQDSKILNYINEENNDRFGVFLGSGIGGVKFIENTEKIIAEKGTKRVSPFFIPGMLVNLLPGNVAIKFGFKGPNFSHVSACASSAHSIGEAFQYIKFGHSDVMIAGGSEFALSKIAMSGFDAMHALSRKYNDNPAIASRPFDKNRDGFIMSDGAAILILEEYEHAKNRNAKIYAEISGYGLSCDAEHITTPNENGIGATKSMNLALKSANLESEQIQYINAHGTSTPVGDDIELKAIYNTFGNYGKKIPISSTKSMTGHLLGATGALEAIACIKSINDQIIPANINYTNPDQISEQFNIVNKLTKIDNLNIVMSNSFGFGGTNCSLIIKKYID